MLLWITLLRFRKLGQKKMTRLFRPPNTHDLFSRVQNPNSGAVHLTNHDEPASTLCGVIVPENWQYLHTAFITCQDCLKACYTLDDMEDVDLPYGRQDRIEIELTDEVSTWR